MVGMDNQGLYEKQNLHFFGIIHPTLGLGHLNEMCIFRNITQCSERFEAFTLLDAVREMSLCPTRALDS